MILLLLLLLRRTGALSEHAERALLRFRIPAADRLNVGESLFAEALTDFCNKISIPRTVA